MFKNLLVITLIVSAGQSNAVGWQQIKERMLGLVGEVAGKSIIHIKNNSGYPIRVGTSDDASNVVERASTLLVKGFTGGYDVIPAGGSAYYETDKDSGIFTVAAQFDEGKDPFFTYCKLDTSKASHTLVFRADGSILGPFVGSFTKHLKCHDETR